LVYALNDIYPVIPELLEEGAGKSVIERIRKVENQLKTAWKELNQAEVDFKKVFNESLKEALKHSAKNIESDELFRAFESEMAIETSIDINKIRLKIASVTQFKPSVELKSKENVELDLSQEELKITQDHTVKEEGAAPSIKAPVLSPETLADDLLQDFPENKNTSVTEPEIYRESDSDLIEDIELLREAILNKAILLAKEANISDLVIKVNRGYGFALADLPQEIHFPGGIDDTHPSFQKVWQVWYQIYTLCGATLDLDTTRYAEFIPYDNDLKALLDLRFEEISDLGQYITTAALRSNLFISSSAHLFQHLDQFIKLIRQLNESATTKKINLWGDDHGE
jgi:hypothetical protein